MNKKITALFVSIILTVGMLVGCGSKGMKDGTYTAEDKNFDDHGWKAYVTIIVSGGKVSDTKFDYTSEDGTTKSKNVVYGEKMSQIAGITPDEYLPQYENALVTTQDPTKIEVVTGATTSHKDFKTLAKIAMDAAKVGNTNTAQVELSK